MRISCAEKGERFGCICEAFDGVRYQVEEKKPCLGWKGGFTKFRARDVCISDFIAA